MVPVPPRRPPAARSVWTSLAVSALVALAACGGTDADADTPHEGSTPEVPSTVSGVGRLPDPVDATRAPIVVRPPVNDDGSPAALVGESVDGNRVLLIGDSILASTSSRYGGQMCATLVPLGWHVQVEAEPSRFIDFGNRVLDRVLPVGVAPDQDWDAAVVFLGSNYSGDEILFEAELREILDRLVPRPTLLFTVTQYRPHYAEVNEIVRRLDTEYDNVTLVDWELAALTPGVLSGDRLHPTDQGRQLIADLVAAALGPVALGEGECLRSAFRDDSNVGGNPDTVLGGSRGSNSGGSTGGSGGRTTTTTPATTPPATTAPPPPVTEAPPAVTNPPVDPPPPPPSDGGGGGDGGGDGGGGDAGGGGGSTGDLGAGGGSGEGGEPGG